MRGNIEKYTAVLQLFADECRRQAGDLSEMQARTEFSAIEPVACSLRGTAAMLGARQVSAAAGAVVRACRIEAETEAIGPACNVLIEELSRCAAAIEDILPETLAPAITEPAPGQLAELLAQLAPLLEHGNLEASHLARKNAGLLQAALGIRAKTLLARIDAFDYDGAVAILRQMNGAAD